ncbi:tautomerase enzyme [Vitiosangium sp. GDMCC 1.1324]|uniref:tautomerase family protein n=1 Tax=Vitiosangium sp. (strain GDMCC 1.1324) TaxID=2138576 RepID=UPI000D3AC2E2|nr:tautomerase enzyme [Vitiosangium sp. GDMCC 1.1324]PTL84933.1 tautomerase enzyme [Vitiosangium sp. GDMCC 1.1324]
MTVITVTTPVGRLSQAQRRVLAETLTDAVLEPEVGQLAPAARVGFQVHFVERSLDTIAIGGKLLADYSPAPDVMTVGIVVMNAAWPPDVRQRVIENVLRRLADACGMQAPSPTWWVQFQVIDEGSWGSRGSTMSILDLLETGVFSPERAAEIRAVLARAGVPR